MMEKSPLKKGDFFCFFRIEWGMKKRIWKKSFWRRGIILLLAVLFIPILELSAESPAVGPAVGPAVSPAISPKEDASPTLVVRREEEDLWSLWITPRLYGLTAGEPAALLLRIHAPDGRFVREITGGYGTRGMTLTHGELPAGEVGVLLDGRLSEAADGAILWVRMKESRDQTQKQGDHMGVTGGDGDPTTLFVLQRGGHVSEIPLTVEVDPSGWREDSCQDSSSQDSCQDSSEDSCQDSNEETTGSVTDQPSASDTNPPETEKIEDVFPSTFLGCRETGVTGGVYTVQFLFKGDGEHTPVICMEGGGILLARSAEVEVQGDVLNACSFFGLKHDRTYTFLVGTDRGWVEVTYEKGRFAGFG